MQQRRLVAFIVNHGAHLPFWVGLDQEGEAPFPLVPVPRDHAIEHPVAPGREPWQPNFHQGRVLRAQVGVLLVYPALVRRLDANIEVHLLDRAVEPDAHLRGRFGQIGGRAGLGAADERVRSDPEGPERKRGGEGAGQEGPAPELTSS